MIESFFGSTANPMVVAAVIAGVTSLIVSVTAQFFNLFSGTRLERLRSELLAQIESTRAQLSDVNSSRSARRDYEYDARRRLYDEIEPLLFQLFEATEQSYYRVRSLARTARIGSLGISDDNWLHEDGYYLYSTIYYIILPAIIFRLIKRRMTFVDLDLDERITIKYYLTKIYAFSITDDFVLAAMEPKLDYTPNIKNRRTLARTNPGQYLRQGLVVGDMDALLDELIIKEEKTVRAITYAEFERRMMPERRSDILKEVRMLFKDFSPNGRPVLARMLLVQACLSNLIVESFEMDAISELKTSIRSFVYSDEFGRSFAWLDEVSAEDKALVEYYIVERLSWIPDRSRRRAGLAFY